MMRLVAKQILIMKPVKNRFWRLPACARRLLGSIGLLVIGLMSSLHAYELTDLPMPPGTKAAWLAPSAQHNGFKLSMRSITSNWAQPELIGFYRQLWAEKSVIGNSESDPVYIEETLGPWMLISTLEGRFHLLVQIKASDSGGSEGFISALDLDMDGSTISAQPDSLEDLLVAPSSELVSITRSSDVIGTSPNQVLSGVLHATTMLIKSHRSVRENHRYYVDTLVGKGWFLMVENNVTSASTLMFQKQRNTCEVSIAEAFDGQTMVVINLVAQGGRA